VRVFVLQESQFSAFGRLAGRSALVLGERFVHVAGLGVRERIVEQRLLVHRPGVARIPAWTVLGVVHGCVFL